MLIYTINILLCALKNLVAFCPHVHRKEMKGVNILYSCSVKRGHKPRLHIFLPHKKTNHCSCISRSADKDPTFRFGTKFWGGACAA